MTTPAQQQEILSALTSDPRFAQDLEKFSSGAANPVLELTSDPQIPAPANAKNPFAPGGFNPNSYQSSKGLVSPEQAADRAIFNKKIEIIDSQQAVENRRVNTIKDFADQDRAQQEWEDFVTESRKRGLEPNPNLFEASNGIVPPGQTNAFVRLNKINAIQDRDTSINKRVQDTVKNWNDVDEEAKQYAKWKAKQTGDRAATEPLPNNTNQSPVVTQESQQNLLPPAQQNITDLQPVSEGPTTGSELGKYILNTTGRTVTTSAPITIDVSATPVPDTPQATQTATSEIGQSFINKTGTVTTTQEPTFSSNKPGMQTEPVGGAELGAPSIQESSKPQTAGSRQGGEGGFFGTNVKIGAVGAAIDFANQVLHGEDPTRAAIKSVVGAAAGILTGGAIQATTGSPILAFGGGTIAAQAAESLVGKSLDLIFGTEGNQGQGQAQGKASLPATEPPAFQGGQCDGVLYNIHYEISAYDSRGQIPDSKIISGQAGDTVSAGNAYGPISVRMAEHDNLQYMQITCHGFPAGTLGNPPYYDPNNTYVYREAPITPQGDGSFYKFDAISVSRPGGLPDNCGNSAPMPSLSGTQTNVTNITNVTYEQPAAQLGQPEPQTQLPPSAPPDDTSKKGGNNTTYIPAGKGATATLGNGQQVPIPASNTPQAIKTSKNGNGQIKVDPGNGQGYTLSSPGNGPVQINIPGYKPYTINPDGTVQGATPNVLNPSTFVPTPLTVTPLKSSPLESTPLQSTPLQSTPLTPTQQQQTTAPTTPDLQSLTTAATVAALLTPILQGITNKLNPIAQNTTPQTLAGAAEKGCCDAFAPGGCNAKIGQDAADAAKNSNNTAAGIGALDLATTNLQLANIAKTVGVGEFPATVPTSLVSTGIAGAELATTKSIPNLARFGQYHLEQMDALLGAFAIPIEIAGQKLSIPNIAEGMAEQIGMEMAGLQNTEALLNLCTRTITEIGQIKQQTYKNYRAIEAVITYLNFKHKEVVENMPLTFVPGETDLASLLTEATQPVSVIEYDDTLNQRTVLLNIAQAAAITHAQNWQTVKGTTPTEIKNEIIQDIKNLKKYSDDLAKEAVDAQGLDATDRLIRDITNGTGYPSDQNPFACEGEEPPTIIRHPQTPGQQQ